MQNLSFVALDLETTGVDETAEIIEIALVKIEDNKVSTSFEKLIKPFRLIPEEITLITGINNEMVANKPTWQEIEKEVKDFIGNNIIIAHNVPFDRGFLERSFGSKLNNLWLDTIDLAKIIMPTLASYKLSYLANHLNIKTNNFHRALIDAKTCAEIFIHFKNVLTKFSPFTLEKLVNIISEEKNGLSFLLTYILKYNIANFSFSKKISTNKENFNENDVKEKVTSFNSCNVESFFEPGGLLSLNNDSYQYRPQQVELFKTIYQAFQSKNHAILEAGTGTGKSLAYLVPALLWAIEKKSKIVISTNTITLQEQLFYNDIPFLKKCLQTNFPIALSKGRNNYICLRRFENLKSQIQKLSWPEKIFVSQLVVWLDKTETGDKEQLNLNSFDNQFWSQVSSQSETCLNSKCSYYGKCYYLKNRRLAEKSNIIITNHALLLQDIKYKNKILPSYDYVIIDEAHNLEDEAIKQFTSNIDLEKIKKICNQFSQSKKSNSWIRRFKSLVTEKSFFIENSEELFIVADSLAEEAALIDKQISEIINSVYVQKDVFNSGEIRITPKERTTNWWIALEKRLQDLLNHLISLNTKLIKLINKIVILEDLEEIAKELDFLETQISQLKKDLKTFINNEREQSAYWLEITNSLKYRNLILSIASINAGQLLKSSLFDTKNSVILTSATMAVKDNLTYTGESFYLNEDEYISLITKSPFNYNEQSMICIPNDLPDPTKVANKEYVENLTKSLIKIIPAVTGGILILFTSFYILNNVYYSLKREQSLLNYNILAHGKDGNRLNLIEALNNNENSIVLGTNSFWEGIDVKGLGLTTVIITKLPFLPPSKPITATKMELMEEEGKNSFYNYSLPQAILKFRQGYGRLIRSSNDWGTVIILDKRIITKRYGKEFLASLPTQNVIKGNTTEICRTLYNWMNSKVSINYL